MTITNHDTRLGQGEKEVKKSFLRVEAKREDSFHFATDGVVPPSFRCSIKLILNRFELMFTTLHDLVPNKASPLKKRQLQWKQQQ
jgi:hypothetical protein